MMDPCDEWRRLCGARWRAIPGAERRRFSSVTELGRIFDFSRRRLEPGDRAALHQLSARWRARKDPAAALGFRLQGNERFAAGEYGRALALYSKGLRYAAIDCPESALLYANRSAALYHVQRYQECLADIGRAERSGYPPELQHKIQSRRAACLQRLAQAEGEGDAGGPQAPREAALLGTQPPVSGGDPCGADPPVSLRSDSSRGRHLIAARDLSPGQVVLQEEAFAAVLIPGVGGEDSPPTQDLHCHQCLCPAPTPLPCPSCSFSCYCSESCRDQAWRLHHQLSCPLAGLLLTLGTAAHLALRTALAAGPGELERVRSLAEEGVYPQGMGGGERPGGYQLIHSLLTHCRSQPPVQRFLCALTAAALCRALQDCSPEGAATDPGAGNTGSSGLEPGSTDPGVGNTGSTDPGLGNTGPGAGHTGSSSLEPGSTGPGVGNTGPGVGNTGSSGPGAWSTGLGARNTGSTGLEITGSTDPGMGNTGPGAGNTGSTDPGVGNTGPGAGNTGSTDPGLGNTGPGAGHTGSSGPEPGNTDPGVGKTGSTGPGVGNTGSTGPGVGNTGSSGLGITGDTSPGALGVAVLRHMLQLQCNAQAITAIRDTGVGCARVMETQQLRIATALFPMASLLNHSCQPNTSVTFHGTSVIIRAAQLIPAGNEVLHCYGPHWSRLAVRERRRALLTQYYFQCGCTACVREEDGVASRSLQAPFLCCHCGSTLAASADCFGEPEEAPYQCSNSTCGYTVSWQFLRQQETELRRRLQGASSLVSTQPEAALELLHRCRAEAGNLLSARHSLQGEIEDGLAQVYACQGDWSTAAQHLRESVSVVRLQFGSRSLELAQQLFKLAQLLFNSRLVGEAVKVIDEAAPLLTTHYGPDHEMLLELRQMESCLQTLHIDGQPPGQ